MPAKYLKPNTILLLPDEWEQLKQIAKRKGTNRHRMMATMLREVIAQDAQQQQSQAA